MPAMGVSDVCSRFGLTPDPPAPGTTVGISRRAMAGIWPVHGLRHLPENGTCGWYIWIGEFSQADDFFQPLHVEHLAERLPGVVPYLDLPAGSRFLIAPDYEDVWEDPSLLIIGSSELERVVLAVVHFLIGRNYDAIETMTRGRRLSAADLHRAVSEYGRVIREPPADWSRLVIVTAIAAAPRSFHVAAPLWTVQEGRSDLTLELHLDPSITGSYDPQVLDLHVL